MLGRYLVSVLLIALGIASPWLVKDWLEWRADGGDQHGFYEKLSGFPEALKSKFDRDEGPGMAVVEEEVEPYPMASRTMKFFQGLMPSRDEVSGALNDSTVTAAESELSRMAARDALPGMGASLAALSLESGDPIFLRVFKEENELEVWMRGRGNSHYTLFRVYRLRGWSGGLGPKLKEGDRQTPEGFYFGSASRMRPHTRHYLGMDLGFPNEYDSFHGRTGSGLMIHGGKSESGAFVLSPEDMGEVYSLSEAALSGGQRIFRIHVFPFRMTDKRMEQEWKRQPDWIDFWVNLKEGYDFFENANFPPDVSVSTGEYAFRFP
jgi:murein L,D-transpeptidase YafK